MKKIIRDFVLLFVLCFLYMTFSKTTNVSAVEGLIISLGSAAIFSLLISMIRNLNEEDLNLKINLTPKEVEIIRQSRLVLRDSIVAFLLCYGSMTVSFGETGLTFIKAIPFMFASLALAFLLYLLNKQLMLVLMMQSLAPALVVCAISKELRMPSNRQEAKVELEELA